MMCAQSRGYPRTAPLAVCGLNLFAWWFCREIADTHPLLTARSMDGGAFCRSGTSGAASGREAQYPDS